MNCTIITIGDELLIGQTVDTNSAWIGQKLNAMGITLKERMAVGDDKSAIINALERAKSKSDVILITGGLGPTKDDITKATFCEFFGVEEVLHEETFDRIKRFFEKRGKELIPMNKKQAMLPANCTVLSNERGTAPGMWFDENNIVYVSMPGVPHEMKHLMETHVIPRLAKRFPLPTIVHKNMMVVGLGESRIAQMISEIEDILPSYIKLAYLPELGVVKLRLSGYEISEEQALELNSFFVEIKETLGKNVFADHETTLSKALGELYKSHQKTFAIAESCTGGYVGHLVTSDAGCSAYFKGSLVTYSYEMKENILGVSAELLNSQGAVSEACVLEMLEGLLSKTNADYGVAISGIAGPDGATASKPVGTVCFAVGNKLWKKAYTLSFFPGRMENIKISSITALDLLRKALLKDVN